MAFNFQVFKTRALTAVIFAAVMLCGLFINTWSYFLLFTLIHFGCWYEYQKLFALIFPAYKKISFIQKMIYPLCGFLLMLWVAGLLNNISYLQDSYKFFGLIILLMIVSEIIFYKKSGAKIIATSIAGFIYISIPIVCMISFRFSGNYFVGTDFNFDMGLFVPVLLIATIWINDTMAYIVGSLIGKTPLTKISPKKTWEGTIGGALLAIAVVSIAGYFLFKADIFSMFIFTFVTVIFATFGDLLESKMKRLAQVKDSGNFMPGHGGFLDRFDSLLFAAPAIWLLMQVL